MNTDSNKKCALITGASRGIGRAAAERFAENGYDLVLTCHNSMSALESLSANLQSAYGISCMPILADMGVEADVTRLFTHISHLDVCFYTCRAAIPLMLKSHRGSIINVSSVWGAQGASLEVAYSASKGGMNALTRALAKELAPSNIQVNAIACGVIDTAMNGCLSLEETEALRLEIPADRLGTPEEVAELIFRTAQAPSYMTGQVITIDGGWYT